MKEFYNGLRFGIITKDPIRIRAFLDNKHTDYCVLYGDDSVRGCETCFVTLNPLDEAQSEYIRCNCSDFTPLETPSKFSKYVIETAYRRLAEAIRKNIPPDTEISELSGTASFMYLDEFDAFFKNLW
ncbi:MAG: hypothetical protein KAR23_02440 [Candidatus Aenigmarchaeota archaeon]|nr:hypothetical protein [Candidatus Aenigmarchaeota archaeon]